MRGAWIEMLVVVLFLRLLVGRSLCGERGLKYEIERTIDVNVKSLPMRGAWIEMLVVVLFLRLPVVAPPMRGAWIEITFRCRPQ